MNNNRSGKSRVIEAVVACVIAVVIFLFGLTTGVKKEQKAQAEREVKIQAAIAEHKAKVEAAKQEAEEKVRKHKQQLTETIRDAAYIDMDVLIYIESKGDPNAHNELTGARGLCQILEPTWNECIEKMDKDWNYQECWNDPYKNKRVGWYYINRRIPQMLIFYNMPDTIETRLSCYDWGIGKVREHYKEYKENGITSADEKYPYPQETKDYIQDYLRLLDYRLTGDPQVLTAKDIANGAGKLRQ
jgi:hypothetical protein